MASGQALPMGSTNRRLKGEGSELQKRILLAIPVFLLLNYKIKILHESQFILSSWNKGKKKKNHPST